MTNHKNFTEDASLPRCRKCQKTLDFQIDEAPLDRFGQFIRLRCSEVLCGHVDWYKEVEFESTAGSFRASPDDTSEVWVHDIVLGLSFKQTDDRA